MQINNLVNRIMSINNLKINSNIPNLSYSFSDLFPSADNSIFFSLFKKTPDLLNILANLQDTYLQQGLVQIKGQARSTNEYDKYLQANNPTISKLDRSIVNVDDTNDEKMYKIEQWVINNIPYESDMKNYGQDEYWSVPTETLRTGSGDCIANYEEIWTKKGLKKVGDLEIGELVLSYDFDEQEYCYKPITKIWEKGKLPVYRVTFSDGTWVDVTKDHPFWARTNANLENPDRQSTYVKTKLQDIDLSKWYKKRVPSTVKLNYITEDIEWLNEDLCFVLGYFLAEGSVSFVKNTNRTEVRMSGNDLDDFILPILNSNNIPYNTWNESRDTTTRLRFKESYFKNYILKLKTSAKDITIPEELFKLPTYKIQAIVDGNFVGDGWYLNKSNRLYHSTISINLVVALKRFYNLLGKSLVINKRGIQKNSWQKQPIWYLYTCPNSRSNKDFGYENISEVSIKKYEYIGDFEVRDFEVKDTHTFVSKFGILGHQCEDGAFLIHSLALNAGVNSDRLRTYGGVVAWQNEVGGLSSGGHGWTAYKTESDNKWIILDWCFFTTDAPFDKRIKMEDNFKYVDDYFFVNLKNTVDTPYSNGIRKPDVHTGYPDTRFTGNIKNIFI